MQRQSAFLFKTILLDLFKTYFGKCLVMHCMTCMTAGVATGQKQPTSFKLVCFLNIMTNIKKTSFILGFTFVYNQIYGTRTGGLSWKVSQQTLASYQDKNSLNYLVFATRAGSKHCGLVLPSPTCRLFPVAGETRRKPTTET